MAVVVHHQGVADTLGIQPRSRRAERPQADRDVEDPIRLGADGHERRRGLGRRPAAIARYDRASGQRSRAQQQRPAAQRQHVNGALVPQAYFPLDYIVEWGKSAGIKQGGER